MTQIPLQEEIPGVDWDLAAIQLEQRLAPDRIRWAQATFGAQLVLSTSFGIQSAVMLHLATQIWPSIPVIFIDTGYLFPETYRFAEELTVRLRLNLHVYQPTMTAARQEALHGKLWEQGQEGLQRYGLINKIEPMSRALGALGASAWLSGIRRSQSASRQATPVLVRQNRTFKIHPLIDWTDRDIHRYLETHGLPYHPLREQGYVSLGDWHSTRQLTDGMSVEETRFNGLKRECGLHEDSGRLDFQI